jgi:hypothetical protein
VWSERPVAFLAVAGFFPIALLLFKRLPRAMAVTASVLCGSLFLPENTRLDLPLLPPMGKEYVTYSAAIIAAWVHQRSAVVSAGIGRGPEVFLVLMLGSNILTATVNSEPMVDEGILEDGLGAYWIIVKTSEDFLGVCLPFFVGRALIRTRQDLCTLLKGLVAVGLVQTALIAVEIAMSIPFRVFQLSDWIYNVPMRPMWRWGIIQPMVFMDNGLSLATYMAGAAIAAAALWRTGIRAWRTSTAATQLLVSAGLLMTWNVAGNVYGHSMAIVARLLTPRSTAMIAGLLGLFAVTYPALRMAGLFPYEELVQMGYDFDPDRGRSLEGRFLEENHVMDHIGDRLWLGWGNISRTPGAETFGTGEQGLDGWWTIQFGAGGASSVLLHYSLFLIPVLLAWRRMRSHAADSQRFATLLAALMLIVSIRMVDLLINGWWNSLPVFLAGALYSTSKASR